MTHTALGAISDSPSAYKNYWATDPRRWLYACEGSTSGQDGLSFDFGSTCEKPGAVGSISLFQVATGSEPVGIYITAGLTAQQVAAYFAKATGGKGFPTHTIAGSDYALLTVPAWVAQACAKTYGIPTNFKQQSVATNTPIHTGTQAAAPKAQGACLPHSHPNNYGGCDCDAGYERNAAGDCVLPIKIACPRGFVRNVQGKCVKIPSTAPSSPQRLNPFGTTKRPPKIGVGDPAPSALTPSTLAGPPRGNPMTIISPRPPQPLGGITAHQAALGNIRRHYQPVGAPMKPQVKQQAQCIAFLSQNETVQQYANRIAGGDVQKVGGRALIAGGKSNEPLGWIRDLAMAARKGATGSTHGWGGVTAGQMFGAATGYRPGGIPLGSCALPERADLSKYLSGAENEPGAVGAPMAPKFKPSPLCMSFANDHETLFALAKRAHISLPDLGNRMVRIGGRLEIGTVREVAEAGRAFILAHPDWWGAPIAGGGNPATNWANANLRILRVGLAAMSGKPVPSGVADNGMPVQICQTAGGSFSQNYQVSPSQVSGPPAANPRASTAAYYVVKQGDTFATICRNMRVSPNALLQANPNRRTQVFNGQTVFQDLYIGDKIRLPVVPATPTRLGAVLGDVCDPDDPEFSVTECAAQTANKIIDDATGGGDTGGGDTGGNNESIGGAIVCGSINEHVDIGVWPPQCVCDAGFVRDANGDCVVDQGPSGGAETGLDALACTQSGGDYSGTQCTCPGNLVYDATKKQCVDAKGNPGSAHVDGTKTGGDTGGKKTGGDTGGKKTGGDNTAPEPPKMGMFGSLSPGMKTALEIGGLAVLALGAAGATYYGVKAAKKKKGKTAEKAA